MTDLRDQILDRLVGTPVGVNWPDGPLAIAAEVIGGPAPVKFGQTDNDRGAKAEIARRLGYPVLLCEAIQGGNRGLIGEDDRRGFAINVFRTIAVAGPMPRLSPLAQNRIAARLAIRAHAYVCDRPECPVPAALGVLVEASPISQKMIGDALEARCETAGCSALGRRGVSWLTARSTREQRLMQAAFQVVRGFDTGQSMGGWCSIRESVRMAASERGAAEAVACCVLIARLCGMAV
jgi:hypothetical protein